MKLDCYLSDLETADNRKSMFNVFVFFRDKDKKNEL